MAAPAQDQTNKGRPERWQQPGRGGQRTELLSQVHCGNRAARQQERQTTSPSLGRKPTAHDIKDMLWQRPKGGTQAQRGHRDSRGTATCPKRPNSKQCAQEDVLSSARFMLWRQQLGRWPLEDWKEEVADEGGVPMRVSAQGNPGPSAGSHIHPPLNKHLQAPGTGQGPAAPQQRPLTIHRNRSRSSWDSDKCHWVKAGLGGKGQRSRQ